MESVGDHDQYARASTDQNDAQPGRTQDIKGQSTSKRKREADDAECQVTPIAKRVRSNCQLAKDNTAAMRDPQLNDSSTKIAGVADMASAPKRRVAPRSKKVRFDPLVKEFEITNCPPEEYAQDCAQGLDGRQILPSVTPLTPAAPKKKRAQKGKLARTPSSVLAKRGRTGLSCTQPSPSQPRTPDGYFPFLLAEIRQTTAQRSRVSGAESPSGLEHELWKDEEYEDDIMKLVIWKFYHGRGVLDPAMLKIYEAMREEMATIESISPELLEVGAQIFIRRRAERHSQGAQGGGDLPVNE